MDRDTQKCTAIRELQSDELVLVSGGSPHKDAKGKPAPAKTPEAPPPPPPYFGPGTFIQIRF